MRALLVAYTLLSFLTACLSWRAGDVLIAGREVKVYVPSTAFQHKGRMPPIYPGKKLLGIFNSPNHHTLYVTYLHMQQTNLLCLRQPTLVYCLLFHCIFYYFINCILLFKDWFFGHTGKELIKTRFVNS